MSYIGLETIVVWRGVIASYGSIRHHIGGGVTTSFGSIRYHISGGEMEKVRAATEFEIQQYLQIQKSN